MTQQVQMQNVTQQAPTWNYQNVFQGQTACAVKQLTEMIEVVLGFETENKYHAFFPNGAQLHCFEQSSFLSRCFCGNKRAFSMTVMCQNQEVLRFTRPFYILFANLFVYDPKTGNLLGQVKQNFSFCERVFTVYVGGQRKYKIVCGICEWWTFHIRDLQGRNLGAIKKQWSGLIKEMYTDADNFGIQFPVSATTEDRAVLFAATFLIDFLFFEKNANKENNSRSYY